jgi:zinc transporter
MSQTTPTAVLAYGREPGLRFACLLDGSGHGADLDWRGVARWHPGDGVLWIHLERDDPAAAAWINDSAGLDPVIAEALLADESRPRVESVGDGMLIVLRGICVVVPGHEAEIATDRNLVPLHIWAERDRIITLRDKRLFLTALRDIRQAIDRGKGPRRSGELLVQIADKVVRDLEPLLDDMDEEVDRLEDQLFDSDVSQVRQHLSRLRRRAVQLRRYLAPQREALNRLEHEDPDWMTDRDKVRIREATDKVLRFIEYLDAIRDRATILHDDLSALIAERIARNSHRLGVLAALLLPPSLIAGLLGMNVGGVPGSAVPWAFGEVCALVAVLSLVVWWILNRIDWL